MIDPVVLAAYLVCAFSIGFLVSMCFEAILRRAEQSHDDDALISTVDRWLRGGDES